MNKRVFHVLGSIYPQVTGGMEIFNYNLLRYRNESLNKKEYYFTTNKLASCPELNVKQHYYRPISVSYPIQLFFAILLNKKKASIIYTTYARQPWILPYLYALIFRIFNLPYIVTIHSGGTPNWKFSYPYKYFFKNAEVLIGVSQPICDDYSKLIPSKNILFIPPLVPFRKSSKSRETIKGDLGYHETSKIILFVGSLKEMKNPDKVLQAFASLTKVYLEIQNVNLLFVGNGGMMDYLTKYTKSQNLTDRVKFTGMVSRELIHDYYTIADIYVIASNYEGTSVSLLEAMYNKLPIISANSPGLNTILTNHENCIMYSTDNIESLANCYKLLLENPSISETLASKANQLFNSNYSFSNVMEQYDNLFNKVIEKYTKHKRK